MKNAIDLHVNGKPHRLEIDPARSLLSVLRDDLGLTGAKYGCGEGQCGACTVLVDGMAVRSCLARVGAVAGKPITTIEGLEQDGKLHPVQAAFLEAGAMQCGYCTCGMILEAVALLREHPKPAREQIVRAMNGNLCRCGTYGRIVTAIEKAAEAMRGEKR
jgi:aerobic-type carbon monoxide dehydrogenase small subunit (CoxS/CutS family)